MVEFRRGAELLKSEYAQKALVRLRGKTITLTISRFSDRRLRKGTGIKLRSFAE